MQLKTFDAAEKAFLWVIYALLTTAFVFLYGRLTALQYDRTRLNCDHYKRGEWHEQWCFTFACVLLFPGALLAAAHRDGLLFAACITQCAIQTGLLLATGYDRVNHRRVLSVRYMELKYGVPFDPLLKLLDRHELSHFPVVWFETFLQLTTEQCASSVASLEDRQRMRLAVKDEFVSTLCGTSASKAHIRRYVDACLTMAQVVKLDEIQKDFRSDKEE